ncbi:class IIb bacteriocin, lactobin A/cerein 7B family [Enterococcus faecalis]|jgi:lactobin A/cerein 7B family class IIb bacteriocin|uniref:class IIb bacteriocin, lactobin A/cerein 7B family n=1 Tax=Enterococcus TaxID=1350 RepID=UPI0019262D7C|nr:class IIb bacteriocin, lactobin A/cerein 7B family [Enterococcus faecalis]MCO5446219.1 class IIb bacteriocin, lactobin A/cerein 7B family [Enterococcus faecalis]
MNNKKVKTLNEKELKQVVGGIGPAVFLAPLGIYLAKQAFEHTDQIGKGIKKGWNKY